MSKRRSRYFQWIEGENAGTVTTLDSITAFDGEYFYNFADGDVCNQRFVAPMTRNAKSLEGKVVVEIATPNDPWVIEKIQAKKYVNPKNNEEYEIPPLEDIVKAEGKSCSVNSAVGQYKYIPPKYRGEMWGLPSIDDYFQDEDSSVEEDITPVLVKSTDIAVEKVAPADITPDRTPDTVSVQQQDICQDIQQDKKKSSTEDTDPVAIIIKNCKKYPTEVTLSLNIWLPQSSMFKMVAADFENGTDKFVDCVVNGIDMEYVKDALKDALKSSYENSVQ